MADLRKNVALPPETVERIERMAAETGRSESKIMRHLIEVALNRKTVAQVGTYGR